MELAVISKNSNGRCKSRNDFFVQILPAKTFKLSCWDNTLRAGAYWQLLTPPSPSWIVKSKIFHFVASVEHSANKIIMQLSLFENEIGTGLLQSSIQQTWALPEYES